MAVPEQFYYTDVTGATCGPVDWQGLRQLYAAGAVNDGSNVIGVGESVWRTYRDYAQTAAQPSSPSPSATVRPGPGAPPSAESFDVTEEMVRQKVAAGAAVAGATARVIGKTAAATIRGTTRALSDAIETGSAASGSSAQPAGGGRGVVAALLGGAFLSMFVLPVLKFDIKGRAETFRMFNLIKNSAGGDASYNMMAVIALLLPIAAIVMLVVRGNRWRLPVVLMSFAAAASAYIAVNNTVKMAGRMTMGIGTMTVEYGLWISIFALVAAGVAALLPALRSSAR